MKTWLLVDCNNLCHRLFHALPRDMEKDGVLNSVIYGFLRDILYIKRLFLTEDIAFAFDKGVPARAHAYPGYKAGRQTVERTAVEVAARQELFRQINLLETTYLREIGFQNVFAAEGFEADDIIASVCRDIHLHDRAIIISSDHDLYQCLRPNVCVFHPVKKEMVSEQTFMVKYGVHPRNWADVKCIAGCKSDDIAGIKGIGEVYAAKYLTGKLPRHTQAFQKIAADNNATWKRNQLVVRLPFPGTPAYTLQQEFITSAAWNAFTGRLGMPSLMDNELLFKKKDVAKKETLWDFTPTEIPKYAPDEDADGDDQQ